MHTNLKIIKSSSFGKEPMCALVVRVTSREVLRRRSCEVANVFEKTTTALSAVRVMVLDRLWSTTSSSERLDQGKGMCRNLPLVRRRLY